MTSSESFETGEGGQHRSQRRARRRRLRPGIVAAVVCAIGLGAVPPAVSANGSDAPSSRTKTVEVFASGAFSTVPRNQGIFRAQVNPLGTFDLTIVPDAASSRDFAVDPVAATLSYTSDAVYTFRARNGEFEGVTASRLTVALQRAADGSLVLAPNGQPVPDLRVPIAVDSIVHITGGTRRYKAITGTLDIDLIMVAGLPGVPPDTTTLVSYARGSGTVAFTRPD